MVTRVGCAGGSGVVAKGGGVMSEIWWKASTYADPRKIVVSRSTDAFVVLENGRKEAKTSGDCWIRPSRDEALACLKARLERDVSRAEDELAYSRRKLARLVEEMLVKP